MTIDTDDRVARVERVCRAIEAAADRGDVIPLAELAGVDPDHVVNAWPVERLLAWTAGHAA